MACPGQPSSARAIRPPADAAVPALQNSTKAILALTFAYILSQFFRSFLAVIAPELMTDLDLTPAQFGWLSSVFFLAFGAAQRAEWRMLQNEPVLAGSMVGRPKLARRIAVMRWPTGRTGGGRGGNCGPTSRHM